VGQSGELGQWVRVSSGGVVLCEMLKLAGRPVELGDLGTECRLAGVSASPPGPAKMALCGQDRIGVGYGRYVGDGMSGALRGYGRSGY